MQQLQQLYLDFLNFFPGFLHPVISIVLAILLIYSAFQVVKRNFIFLILLIVLLPASLPILKEALDLVIKLVKFLFGAR